MVFVLLAVSAAPPKVVPLPEIMPATVVVLALPDMMQFLIVLLVAPSLAEALAIQIAALLVPVSLSTIVRLRSVPPLFDPSIVTKSAPFSLITVVVAVTVTLWPVAGLIVTVLVELAPGMAFKMSGKVSPVL